MITVLGDRVLVLLPPEKPDTVTASGIVLLRDPDAAQLPTQGIVVQLGKKSGTCDLNEVRSVVDRFLIATMKKPPAPALLFNHVHMGIARLLLRLRPAPFDVAVGDCILFPLGAGEEFTDDGHTYVVLREAEIIGVVPPKELVAQ